MFDEDNKNKTKIYLSPEELEEALKDYKEYHKPEDVDVLERAKHMSKIFGDSFVMTVNKDVCLEALLGGPIYDDPSQIECKELTPRQLQLLRANDRSNDVANMLKELNKSDCVRTSMIIHKDGVDKNLRGMTIEHMYIDDFYYNLPEPPDTTAIEVIQTTDYERISRIADYYSYSHYLIDAFVLDAMIEEKEKNNDITVSKISYRCSIPYNNGMYNTNHNENVPARRRHSRHR